MQWPTLLLQNFSNARSNVTSVLCKVASSRGAGKIKRPNFDYKEWEDFGVRLMKSNKFTRSFVSYSARAAHFQGYTQSSKVHPESKA